MTILVTGGAGTIGSHVLTQLSGHGLAIKALTRDPNKANSRTALLRSKATCSTWSRCATP